MPWRVPVDFDRPVQVRTVEAKVRDAMPLFIEQVGNPITGTSNLTPPQNVQWDIHSLWIELQTSAVVATRTPMLFYVDQRGQANRQALASATPSIVVQYQGQPSLPFSSNDATPYFGRTFPLLMRTLSWPCYIGVNIINPQVGDTVTTRLLVTERRQEL